MGKTGQKPGNRESLIKILKAVTPQADFNDEETLFGRILDDYNAYAGLLDKENERIRTEDSLEAEYRHNTSASMAEIERMTNDEGLDADEVDRAIAELKRISAETASGNYTTENVRMMLTLLRRDADIEAARKEGEIEGRNAAIEQHLADADDSDGLPMLAGANSGISRRDVSIFDIAAGM